LELGAGPAALVPTDQKIIQQISGIAFRYLAFTATLPPSWKSGGQKEGMMSHINNFWKDEGGQDLIEYSILISFVTIAVVGLFMGPSHDVKNAWTVSNNQLTKANIGAS